MDILDKFGEALAVLYRDEPQQSLDTFHDWAFDTLSSVIGLDAGFWGVGAWAANGEPVMRNVHLHRLPATMHDDWAVLKTDPAHLAILEKVCAAGRSVILGPDELKGDPMCAKYGIAAIATSCILDPTTRLLNILSFYRFVGGAPFDEQGRRLHQALVPHLFDLERRVWLRQFCGPRSRHDMGDNQAICDREGTLRLTQQGFVRAMLAEWPFWRGPSVPETLLDVVRCGQSREIVGEHAVVAIARQREMFILTARKRGPIDTLSPRERIVAQKWSRGYSHKEIAARMEISPATVRNHVAKIYDKLAVTGRQQLSKALGESK